MRNYKLQIRAHGRVEEVIVRAMNEAAARRLFQVTWAEIISCCIE